MASRRPGKTVPVEGPSAKTIHVKFFDDGSVRFRLNKAGPMVLPYAFLPGSELNVVVQITPKLPSQWLS